MTTQQAQARPLADRSTAELVAELDAILDRLVRLAAGAEAAGR